MITLFTLFILTMVTLFIGTMLLGVTALALFDLLPFVLFVWAVMIIVKCLTKGKHDKKEKKD